MRWDFGFTCPFCLLHESDLVEFGAEGTGMMTIEHASLRSQEPEAIHSYANCLLCCRYCNRSRGILPLIHAVSGARLLDPTTTAWSEHFVRDDDRLRPRPGDADAEYTHQAYRIDSERKIRTRRHRRMLIADRIQLLGEWHSKSRRLQELGKTSHGRRAVRAVELSQELRKRALTALEELSRYSIVPEDRDLTCQCEGRVPLTLPPELERQAINVTAFTIP